MSEVHQQVERRKNLVYGITYPSWFGCDFVYWLWLKFCCSRGWHLWDECLTPDSHYLSCDACGKVVYLKK